MKTIYLLYKLERRAEATDTIIFFASQSRGLLEEIILSLYEELCEREETQAEQYTDEVDYLHIYKECAKKVAVYQILEIPLLKG